MVGHGKEGHERCDRRGGKGCNGEGIGVEREGRVEYKRKKGSIHNQHILDPPLQRSFPSTRRYPVIQPFTFPTHIQAKVAKQYQRKAYRKSQPVNRLTSSLASCSPQTNVLPTNSKHLKSKCWIAVAAKRFVRLMSNESCCHTDASTPVSSNLLTYRSPSSHPLENLVNLCNWHQGKSSLVLEHFQKRNVVFC